VATPPSGAGSGWHAADVAAQWLARLADDPAVPVPVPASASLPEQQLALAWALKDACYASWHADPAHAVVAAQALSRLAAPAPGRLDGAGWIEIETEIAAVAAWTAGIADLTRGAMSDAVAGFDRAAAAFGSLQQAHRAAQTQVPKIMALSMLGQHDEAAACAELTLQAFTRDGDAASAAKVSQNLGSLHMHRDAYAAAARSYREAAVLFARSGQMQASVAADIGLADALTAQGDFDAAGHMYARARLRALHHGLPVLVAIVDESVALLELARGRYQPALDGLERARRAYESLGMPQHLAVAEKQLADVYLELRLLPEALALFEAALPRFDALEMLPEQAWTLAQRGRTLALLGQGPAAADALEQAAQRFALHDNAVGTAAVALSRAKLVAEGGDTGAALALANQAAAGFAAAGLAEGQLRAELAGAQLRLAQQDVQAASAAFADALARARALGILPLQMRALTGQGLVALQHGQHAGATAAFEAAVLLFEDQRRTLAGDEFRHAFLADHLRPYRELLALALAPPPGQQPDPAQVLQHLERVRARSLAEHLTGHQAVDPDPDVSGLRARLNWLYRRLRKAQDEATESAALTAELRATERELLKHVRRQRWAGAAADATAGTPTSPGADAAGAVAELADDGLDLAALCAALGPQDALVEYGVCGDELLACVVRPGGVQMVRHLAAWPQVLEAAQSVWFQMDTLRHGSAPVAHHLPRLALRAQQRLQRLHALLWAPLAVALHGCQRVLVVPHAELAALPFAALHDGSSWVGQNLQLVMAPSARVALHGLRSAAPRGQPAALRALVLGESTRLPQAGAEARHVASLYEGSRCLVDEAATLPALREAAPSADIIHLACHAQFRADNPMFSALHLRDGALTAEWLQGLVLRPAVVVLSACETGLSESRLGDEMVGLVRAFLVAGAARVVAALWPVDDAVTEQFMAAFHGALAAGQPCATALQAAQAQVRQHHPHPFYWAGFVVQGGW
jgi:tetratricopeptide (TPR) repeat protein